MGGHHPRHAAPETGHMRRMAAAVIGPIGVLTLAAMIWLWPSQPVTDPEESGAAQQSRGEVLAINKVQCPENLPDDVNGCGTAEVRISAGTDKERQLETTLPNGPGAPQLGVGDDAVLIETDTPDGTAYAIVDHQRSRELWILAGAFALAVIAFGRWRGVAALGGLAVTFALLLLLLLRRPGHPRR